MTKNNYKNRSSYWRISKITCAILAMIMFGLTNVNAQTTVLSGTGDGGFETGGTFGANGWTVVNAATNQWVCSTGATAGFTGVNCAYVSNNPGGAPPTHTYTKTSTQVSHMYRDITIPSGETTISLTFNWVNLGEGTFDRMRVWMTSTGYTPVAGTQTTATGVAPTGRIQVGGNLSAQSTWQSASLTIPGAWATGSPVRIVFEWRNDGSGGGDPPGALDNINIVSSCSGPTSNAAANITNNSADISWSSLVGATGYNVEYRVVGAVSWTAASGNPYAGTSTTLGSLLGNTNYQYRVSALGPVCLAPGTVTNFTTIPDPQVPVSSYPFVEGAETGMTSWTFMNGTQPNKWAVGTATSNGGSNGVYISQDLGATYSYNINSASTVQMYRDFNMPSALEINLSFNWTSLGESCCDYMRLWLVPTTFYPTPGTQITATGVAPTGRVQIGGNINNNGTWTTANYTIPVAYAGTSFRLVFEWKNDGSIGPSPGMALDNINVNYSNCASPTSVALAVVNATSADLSWASAGNYFIEWGPNGYTPGTGATAGGSATGSAAVSSSPYSITTGLADTYDVYIRQDCGGSGYSSNVFKDFDFLQGDECFSAETITCSLTPYTGSTAGYTLGVDPTGGTGCGAGGYTAPTRWFKLAGTNELVTIDLSGSAYDTRVTVMSGSCGTLTCVAGDDDSGTGTTSMVSFNAFTGTDYYVIVHGYSTASGAYNMLVTCAFLCLPITGNDECATATPLTLGATANGNNECATASAQGPISFSCGGSFASYYDVWFGFTTNANTIYNISINTTGAASPVAAGSHYFTLVSACGPGTSCTAFDMATGVNTEVTLTASTAYLLRIYTSSQDVGLYTLGNFKVTVAAVTCPAPSALSAAATSNSANLSWTNNSSATAFQIELGTVPYTFTGTANYSGSYPTPFNVTGLNPGTQYTYRVRNNCGVGDDSNWSAAFVFATTPVNDEICNAISLPVNNTCTEITTNNNGATLTTGVTATTCGTPSTDVWYKFVAPASGEVIINVANNGGLSDAVMQLYSGTGTCPTIPTLTALICNDDGGPGLLPLISTTDPLTDITLVGGDTYYVRLWGFLASTGSFKMCIVNGAAPAPANDEPANATNVPVAGNAYPSCGALTGDLSTATNSAQSVTFTGADLWYKFTAQSTGCRIVLSSGSMNGAITLLDNTFNEIQTENANGATGGTEIMNFGGLTVGQVYYVGVGQDIGAGGSTFSLCVQSLRQSTCADGPGAYDLCTNFKPTYTGASSYVMSFTQTFPSAGPTTTASTTNQLALSSPTLDLQHNYGYNVTIDAVYNLVNGVGTPETITVLGAAPSCAITIANHPDLRTKFAQRCPATVFKGTTLQAKPFICAADFHSITFTEVGDCSGTNVGGIPFSTTTSGSSPTKKLSQVAGVQAGKWYEVTWTPHFSYGYGTPGTTDIIYVAASSGAEDVVSEFDNTLVSDEAVVSANIYPNPNNGDMVNINITDITSDNVFVRIFDGMGRVVFVDRFTVDGSLNTNVTFTKPLANGLYMVEFTVDGETFTERMIVEK